MIRKTQKIFKRRVKNHAGWQTTEERTRFGDGHNEVVARNTWWLFGVIPLYMREAIVAHDLTL